MPMKIKRLFPAVLALVLALLCSGCLFVTSAEELYVLPQGSEEYVELQAKINTVLDSGAEYSAPLTGNYRQAVLLRDLDGDGTDEAIGFFSHEGEKPLMIIIFKKTDDDYSTAAVIEGDGTAIDSVSYIDMDGDGVQEFIVGWQMSVSMKMLSVYSLRNFNVTELAESDYTRYTQADLDDLPGTDLLVFHLSEEEQTGELIRYSLMPDGEITTASAKMSEGIASVSSVRTGYMSDGMRGVFVDSTCVDSAMITDVFSAVEHGTLSNITLSGEMKAASNTIRYGSTLTCADIDGDGFVEIPQTRELVSQTETVYRVTDWKNVTTNGMGDTDFTTYHNISDGWYLRLPKQWGEKLVIRRVDSAVGERTIIFSVLEEGGDTPVTDLAAITVLSGDNRRGRAKLRDRFQLFDSGETIYVGRIITDKSELSITKDYLIQNFSLIYSDWNT